MREADDELIPTRRSLLSRLRGWEDHASWQEFFDTYWKLIYGVAIKAGLAEDEAQEVVQETVISVAKTMPDFKYEPETCSFKGWLRHLTEKRIADQFRRRPREVPVSDLSAGESCAGLDLELQPDPAGPALEAVWDAEWERNLVEAALEKLQLQVNAKQYQIFYLHVIQQMPAKEVGAVVGVGVGQVYLVKHRLARLFKKAVQTLEKKFV